MAFACFVTSSSTPPTNLKLPSFSTSNQIYVLKGAARKSISCNVSTPQQLGLTFTPSIPQNGQKGETKLIPGIIRPDELLRSHFPENFIFGAGTSAIQIEGDGTEGGRGPSTGDYMIHADNGGKGVDSYNKFKEDVALLKEMRIPYYRFSIAWPRILPGTSTTNSY